MSLPYELLDQAIHLADKDLPKNPEQASLRRAVSTAYYALFHLLIEDAVNQWAVERHRNILARSVQHQRVKKICENVLKRKETVPSDLVKVADVFIQLREQREIADYDISAIWTHERTWNQLFLAADAFNSWEGVREHAAARDFLLELLFSVRPS